MTGDFSSAIHCRMKFDPIKPAPPVTRMVDCMERQQSILIKFDELGRMCTQMSAPALETSIMRRRFGSRCLRAEPLRGSTSSEVINVLVADSNQMQCQLLTAALPGRSSK